MPRKVVAISNKMRLPHSEVTCLHLSRRGGLNMEFSAKSILMNAVKKKSKMGNEYIQVSLLDNETSEIFTTYSEDSYMLELDKLKEYAFVFTYNNKYKNFKITSFKK
ncbi:hypothetical protein DSECCO2_519970 [anaerobic digester metagenome]